MKFYIKHRDELKWKELSSKNGIYIDLPVIMGERVDGKFDSLTLQMYTGESLDDIDLTKAIPPKYEIKYTEVDNEREEIEGVNTFYFITDENSSARKRKKTIKEDGIVVEALYQHKIEAVERLYYLDNRYLPNYTIRQPKSRFYSLETKSSGADFSLNKRVIFNGENYSFDDVSIRRLAEHNTNEEFEYGFDPNKGIYIEFKDINKVPLSLTFEINESKAAPSYIRTGSIFGKREIQISLGYLTSPYSETRYKSRVEYYDENGDLIDYTNENFETRYSAGEVNGSVPIFGIPTIKSLGAIRPSNYFLNINKHDSASSVRVYLNLSSTRLEYLSDGVGGAVVDIPGFPSETIFNVGTVSNIMVKADTGIYETEIDIKYTTLLEFVEKALHDYNLNSREKITLHEDVKPLLDVVAIESEWGGYTLRELLERAFKTVGIVPYLTINNEITYRKTKKVAEYIDLEDVMGKEEEHIGGDYYDKVVSNTKNLVSEEDFVTEVLPFTSLDSEFSQITYENGGFQTSGKIYFVSQAILHTPGLEINFGKETYNTNMNRPYYWDITKRLFEEDIYNSFPNVRVDYIVSQGGIPPRSVSSLLTQANTIYYKSGGRFIGGTLNVGEYVPKYEWWDGWQGVLSFGQENGEYAIIEMIISLAYELVNDIYDVNEPMPDVELKDIINYELILTYCPIFDEITTKYSSNMANRKALNWEKKLNIKDRVVSYQNNEEILRNEMERKGNSKIIYRDVVGSVAETIPVNSIINDGLRVSNKALTIGKNRVEVEYVLQENLIIQNEDIRLPVEFERYNVPYEYVDREIMIENHLIFSKRLLPKYIGEKNASSREFIETIFLGTGDIEGPIYGKVNIDGRDILLRFSKLETRFTMLFSGGFLDNYTAGVQRYEGAEGSAIFYSTPYRYTDGNGKFKELKDLEIGWNTKFPDSRIGRVGNRQYDIKMFPLSKYEGFEVELNKKLFDIKEPLQLLKDAGERTTITLTNYLTNESEDIKFYNFKSITKIGYLIEDVYLNDDLRLVDIKYMDYKGDYNIGIETFSFNINKVRIAVEDVSLFEKGIVLVNETRGKEYLVGVIKEPRVEENDIIFFISTTRYGFIKDIPYKEYISISEKQVLRKSLESQNIRIIDIPIIEEQPLTSVLEYTRVDIPKIEINATQAILSVLDSERFDIPAIDIVEKQRLVSLVNNVFIDLPRFNIKEQQSLVSLVDSVIMDLPRFNIEEEQRLVSLASNEYMGIASFDIVEKQYLTKHLNSVIIDLPRFDIEEEQRLTTYSNSIIIDIPRVDIDDSQEIISYSDYVGISNLVFNINDIQEITNMKELE